MVIDAPFGRWDLATLVLSLLQLLLFWVVGLYLAGIIYYCRRAKRYFYLLRLRLRGNMPQLDLLFFFFCSSRDNCVTGIQRARTCATWYLVHAAVQHLVFTRITRFTVN